jgi:DNA processing protein
MITAYLANDYNRDVFTFPGNVKMPSMKGNHKLVKTQVAHLIVCGEDLAQIMGWSQPTRKGLSQASLFPELTEEERSLLSFFELQGSWRLDDLMLSIAWPFSRMAAVILQLEFKGLLRQKPGQQVERC